MKNRRSPRSAKTRKQRGGGKALLNFLLSILAASILIVDTPTVKKALKSSNQTLTSYREPVGELSNGVVPVGGTSTTAFVGEHIPMNRVAGGTIVLPDKTFDSEMGDLHIKLMSFLNPSEYKELMGIIRHAHETNQDVPAAMMAYFVRIGKASFAANGKLNLESSL